LITGSPEIIIYRDSPDLGSDQKEISKNLQVRLFCYYIQYDSKVDLILLIED